MFKVLILQASHSLSDERTEFLIKDRLSFMRFLGLGLADPVPDANTIWTFREALTRATLGGRPAIEVLFGAYEAALTRAGFLAMGGQIVDASIIAAPKQRNTDAEKRDIKEGRIPAGWADKPAKLAQKDRDARWTVKWSKAKPAEDGSPRIDLAVPAFGYKNPCRHRSSSRPDPHLDGDGRGPSRRGPTARPDLEGKYRQRCVGRYGLSFTCEREAPGRERPTLTDSPQEAAAQADAQPHGPGERGQVEGASRRRARVRTREGADGTGRAHDRSGQSAGEDRACQPRLQHEANDLAHRPSRLGIGG